MAIRQPAPYALDSPPLQEASNAGRFRQWRGDLIGLLVLLLVTTAVIVRNVHSDAWMSRTDLLTAYIPSYTYLGEQLRHFNLPAWSPFQASGLPFAGDPQSGWMYFPAMIFYTFLAPATATKAVMAAHLVIAGFSTYAFARVLGLRVVASLAAAVSFALGANVFHTTYCCTIWSQLSTWIPVGLLGVELGVRPGALRYRAGGWAIAAIAISQMFAGWIGQGVYNGLLILGAYTVYRTLISPPGRGSVLRERLKMLVISGGAILLLGLALSAAGILPRLDANENSVLADGSYDEVTDAGDDGGWPPELLLRRLFDDRTVLPGDIYDAQMYRRYYLGTVTAGLAIVAIAMARRRFAAPFFLVTGLALLVLVTKETPLHRLFYLLPRYESLQAHTPFRLMGLFFIFPAILAGAAIESIPDWARRRWWFAVAFVPIGSILWINEFVETRRRHIDPYVIGVMAFVSVTLLAAYAIAQLAPRLGQQRSAALLRIIPLLLLLAILWEPTGRQLITPASDPDRLPGTTQATVTSALSDEDSGGAGAFLQEQLRTSNEPFRYFGYDAIGLRTAKEPGSTYQGRVTDRSIQELLVSAKATMLGLYDIQGYNPAQSQDYADFITALNGGIEQNYHDVNVLSSGIASPLLDLLNVRYIVVPLDVPPGRPDLLRLSQLYPTVYASDTVRVLENRDALPHAWIVHQTQIADTNEALALLGSGAIDPSQTALVSGDQPELSPAASTSDDSVRFDHYRADSIRMTASTSQASLLVVSEIAAPGWNAYVDGKRVDTYTVNALQRGIVLPGGSHTVELRYEPRSLRAGIAISGLALIAILAIFGTIVLPFAPERLRLSSVRGWRKRLVARMSIRQSG
jgi:hypothetical protein